MEYWVHVRRLSPSLQYSITAIFSREEFSYV
jgi:hypothetical protein